MNKQDKKRLLEYYDDLNNEVNTIFHLVLFKSEEPAIIQQIQKVKALLSSMFETFDLDYDHVDEHLGCYSYPNCDIMSEGCCVLHGLNAEPYGHRD